jgi:hypothetical protein
LHISGNYISDEEEDDQIGSIAPTEAERAILAGFMAMSVTAGTLKRYNPGRMEWQAFVKRRTRGDRIPDPFLSNESTQDKEAILIMLFMERHREGKREKGATGIGSAIRKQFEISMIDTKWFESSLIKNARKACRRTVAENREYAKSGRSSETTYLAGTAIEDAR